MKKMVFSLLLAAAILQASPKYVFLFIGDGMSTPQRMIANEYSKTIGNGPLAINNLPYCATTKTNCADKIVTDSAAAATAIACGEKTSYTQLGVSADGKRRLESVAELAHKKGKKVGIITSVIINHATPAGFYAHRISRGAYYQIGLDLIASDFEFFAGGGFGGYENKTDDKEYKGNLYELAKTAGYSIVRTKNEFNALTSGKGKVLATFTNGNLPHAIDDNGEYPNLADITSKAIELLKGPQGFFMMVEGGTIDYSGHANDAATNMKEVVAFDNAVKVALKFAESHKDETLILVTGDHETGGMTIGFQNTGFALRLGLLDNQKKSVAAFTEIYKKAVQANKDFSFEDAQKLMTNYFGFRFDGEQHDPMTITAKELEKLQKAFEKNKMNIPGEARIMIGAKAGIGWATGSHTALPVLTTAQGVNADLFTGFIDNTDVSKKLKSIL